MRDAAERLKALRDRCRRNAEIILPTVQLMNCVPLDRNEAPVARFAQDELTDWNEVADELTAIIEGVAEITCKPDLATRPVSSLTGEIEAAEEENGTGPGPTFYHKGYCQGLRDARQIVERVLREERLNG